jgi:hypothetical protein
VEPEKENYDVETCSVGHSRSPCPSLAHEALRSELGAKNRICHLPGCSATAIDIADLLYVTGPKARRSSLIGEVDEVRLFRTLFSSNGQ